MKEADIEDLSWIRIFTPDHIPTYLVEQIKNRDYSVEDFYSYHQKVDLIQDEDGMRLNPLVHLYVLVDKNKMVKGFLWFSIDTLGRDLFIQVFSMDKEYWGKGKAVEKLANFIKKFRKEANLNKVYWVTNYPKHSERHGFKRSKSVLMEYTEGKDGENISRRSGTHREHRSSESSTTTVSESTIDTGDVPTSGTSVSEFSTTL